MKFTTSKTGGRTASGKTPYGDYRVEFLADYDGPVFDAHGNEVGRITVKIKTPAPPPSRGLGDTIEKLTSKVGIKSCGGCKRRRDKLNKAIPYRKNQE